jgi:hypothetical protein
MSVSCRQSASVAHWLNRPGIAGPPVGGGMALRPPALQMLEALQMSGIGCSSTHEQSESCAQAHLCMTIAEHIRSTKQAPCKCARLLTNVGIAPGLRAARRDSSHCSDRYPEWLLKCCLPPFSEGREESVPEGGVHGRGHSHHRCLVGLNFRVSRPHRTSLVVHHRPTTKSSSDTNRHGLAGRLGRRCGWCVAFVRIATREIDKYLWVVGKGDRS